jgi:hypothetical protein
MNKHSLEIEKQIKYHLKEIERLSRQSLFFSKEHLNNESKQSCNKPIKIRNST